MRNPCCQRAAIDKTARDKAGKRLRRTNLNHRHNIAVLESFVFQDNIPDSIGTDLSLGIESRPLLNNNWIFRAGVSGLLPGDGFQALYGPITGQLPNLFAAFTDLELAF